IGLADQHVDAPLVLPEADQQGEAQPVGEELRDHRAQFTVELGRVQPLGEGEVEDEQGHRDGVDTVGEREEADRGAHRHRRGGGEPLAGGGDERGRVLGHGTHRTRTRCAPRTPRAPARA
ncbi:hypothetical protein ADL26_16935, partial [Thermoactinomyces vulgaris]